MSISLAIHGHPPAFPNGPPPWPIPDPDVLAALETAYENGSWGVYEGPSCDAFREELAEFHDVQFAQLCCSGTIAVEIALRSVGVSPGDEVILAAYDFSGNFRSIAATGATPVLVDIDPRTWSMPEDQLSAAVSEKTKAILASHLHGGSAAIAAICEFASQRGIAVVEDACQAHGAIINDRRAGSSGDVGILSFGGSKLMTSGRGGAVLTNNALFAQRAKVFAGEGNDAFAMSELQAAVLRPQLEKLDEQNAIRSARVRSLLNLLGDEPELTPIELPNDPRGASHFKTAWNLAVGVPNGTPPPRERFIAAANAEGIQFGVGFRGFAKRSSRRCRKPVSLPHSIAAAEETLLLHHPILLQSQEQIEVAAASIRNICHALREQVL